MTPPRTPILESGDRLARCEFERRYAGLPHVKKAELIEGVVFMGSPVRADLHGEPHARLMLWLGLYALDTPGVRLAWKYASAEGSHTDTSLRVSGRGSFPG